MLKSILLAVPVSAYSPRLGTISDARFQTALDGFGLGRLLAATPITRGLFGQNVVLQSSLGAFVLRGCPHCCMNAPTSRCPGRI